VALAVCHDRSARPGRARRRIGKADAMGSSIKSATFIKTVVKAEQAPAARPAVVFAGRSNVGKSSLINKLTGQKGLARTSSTPGRTQEIIYFDVESSTGRRWHFIDLPGYGYAKAPLAVRRRWGPMIERFLHDAPGLRLIVVILDARRDPTDEDRQSIEWLHARGLTFIFAVTKIDKLSRAELARRLKGLQETLELPDGDALVPVSAVKGDGIGDLLGVIRNVLDAPASGA
jgi:GTP-binding protein